METAAQKWFKRVLEPFGQNAGVELDVATDGLVVSGQGANSEHVHIKLGKSTFHYNGTENILIIQLGSLELEIRTPDPETRAPSPDTSSPAHG